MRILFHKLIVLFSLIILTILFILELPYDEDSFLNGLYIKHDIVDDIDTSNKVIVIGGSNVAFGVDSTLIERELGVKVVNLGLHAGMGMKFILEDVESYINSGDTLIIAMEYNHFYDNVYLGEKALAEVALENPRILFYELSNNQRWTVLKNSSSYLRTKSLGLLTSRRKDSIDESMYSIHSFNEYGDIIIDVNKNTNRKVEPIIIGVDLSYEAFDFIENFTKNLVENGIDVKYTFPCLQYDTYLLNKEKIDIVEKELKQRLGKLVISEVDSYLFTDEYLLDTPYHLNSDGIALRTQTLLEDILNENYTVITISENK